MHENRKNIFLICGESSGNKHAFELIKSYNLHFGDVSFSAIGGEDLQTLGVRLLYNFSNLNYIGFTSVAMNYFALKNKLNIAIEHVRFEDPDAVILIDSPGFNLRFIKSIRNFYQGKIIYYISPQLWAWHKSRVKTIRQYCDMMLVVFPFEVDFYKRENVNAIYVGNPLMKRVRDFQSINQDTSFEKSFITLLPGSRKQEIEKIFPVIYEAGKRLSDEYKLKLQLIHPVGFDVSLFGDCPGLEFIKNSNDDIFYEAISKSALALTKIGTASMECALLEVPFISGYKTNFVNYTIAKSLAKIEYLTMANILLNRSVIKEFIQNDFNANNFILVGRKIFNDTSYRDKLLSGLKEVKEILTDEDASYNAARIIHDTLK